MSRIRAILSDSMPPCAPIPDELKEFMVLCRASKLFSVQEWIAQGKRFQMPEGTFQTFPLRVAIQSGFHSMVEVILKAGVSQHEKDKMLEWAVWRGKREYFELLAEYGADLTCVNPLGNILYSNPEIIRFFVDRGFDFETDWPIARALRRRSHTALAVFKHLRGKVPSAKEQATMALRVHARDGNLKWVSLLLWAGADPRLPVAALGEKEVDSDFISTALSEAFCAGQIDVIRKFKFSADLDDPTELLRECAFICRKDIVLMLLEAGANPSVTDRGDSVTGSMMWALQSSLDGSRWRTPESALECLALVAKAGARWRPTDSSGFNSMRRSLAKVDPYKAISYLKELVECQVIEPDVLRELMRTPKMVSVLSAPVPGVIQLREMAGIDIKENPPARRRPGRGIGSKRITPPDAAPQSSTPGAIPP